MDLHIYVHVLNEPLDHGANRKLDRILAHLQTISLQESHIMTDLTGITAQVTETTTIERSAIVLLNGLADKLAEAGTDPTKLAELQTALKANSDDLAAAITKNTPAAPTA